MRKSFLFLLLPLFFLVGCTKDRVQVVMMQKCSAVVGIKYYRNSFIFSYVNKLYVLEDGREIEATARIESIIRPSYEYCETEFLPGDGMEKINKPAQWEVPGLRSGSIGKPCPKDKCPELYKN